MCKLEKFNELSARYGGEFAAIMKDSRYKGPVIFFDIRLAHLEALKIPSPEEKINPLLEMLELFIRGYEQMNSFILCDDVALCRFYSTSQICKLLSSKNLKPEFMWHSIFQKSEYQSFIPDDIHGNFPLAEWYAHHGDAFACMRFKEIPASYIKFDVEVVGVENYLPEVMYFLMDNIKKGCYPDVVYPCQYKPVGFSSFVKPKFAYWHLDTGTLTVENVKIPKNVFYPRRH